MWRLIAILIGGYGFVVLTFAGTWATVNILSQCTEAGGRGRLKKSDAYAVLIVMAVWTLTWTVIALVELT